MKKKYLGFRDLNNEDNLVNGTTYHAAGIVIDVVNESTSPSKSGKDLFVYFLEPFTGRVTATWRSYKEVELFELDKVDYNYTKQVLGFIEYNEV